MKEGTIKASYFSTVTSQIYKIFRYIDFTLHSTIKVTLIPAHRASGVCLQNWAHLSHPECCQFPADNALSNTERKTAWAEGKKE